MKADGMSMHRFVAVRPRHGATVVAFVVGVFGLLTVALASPAAAAPVNDNFVAAQVVSGAPGAASGTTVGATKEPGEPNHANNVGGASIWYSWTAPSGGAFTFDTCGSAFDTTLAVYTGSAVNALSLVTANDDSCGAQSRVTFTASAGTTYRIAIDGWKFTSGVVSSGATVLNWRPVPPPNDNFGAAQSVSGATGTASGTTVGATREPGEPNHGGTSGSASIWYRWTAPDGGIFTFDTCGSAFDTLLAVYTGSAVNALSQLSANDQSCGNQSQVTFTATKGTIYRIAIDGSQGQSGATLLNWRGFPGAPTIGTATPGVASATVSFTPPASGGSPITSYTAVSSPGGITASGPSSPITVSGLTNETTYTFTVYATNAVGNGPPSAPSNPVTPSTTPFFSVNDVTVTEGNTATKVATFTVTRFGNTAGSSSVKYKTVNGTAVAPGDYTALAPFGPLSFAAGQTTKTVNVSVKGDVAVEPDETFTLELSEPVGARLFDAAGTATIQNDDSDAPPTFSVNDVSVLEGNSGTKLASFTVSRAGSTAATASVQYRTANGTAHAPGDYTSKPLTNLNFAIGQTTATVSVAVKGDLYGEANETFFLELYSPVRATIADGVGTATIHNDDSTGPPTLFVNDAWVVEGDAATKLATFTIYRSGNLSEASSVKYATADGTAVAPGDYTAKALTTVSFAAGEATKTVAVTIKGDLVGEANETFRLNLSAPVGATIGWGSGVGTIENDDSNESPSFSVNDASVTEGHSLTKAMTFTITRSGNLAAAASVKVATADGTAVAPGDYTAKALTTVSFAAGEATKTVAVTIRGEQLVEPDETFTLNLSVPVGADITDGVGTGTILSDDV